MSKQETQTSSIKIAVVGDVHDLWDETDKVALQALQVDLVLLVGDFGNESVEIVRSISTLELPKAVILGNHDAWYTASAWGKKQSPYNHEKEDRVQQQLDLLGATHVGYGKREFPDLGLTVVGGRPFSWGGSDWKNHKFYETRFGIHSFAESAARIVSMAMQAEQETIVFMGHCGPKGLGDRAEDPCGKDWEPGGGDHGDPDLAEAIAQTRQFGKRVPLVVFGHMHHHLRPPAQHPRIPIYRDHAGTFYLNSAIVPRIIEKEGNSLRNFSIVELEKGEVTQASVIWIDQNFSVTSEQILWSRSSTLTKVICPKK